MTAPELKKLLAELKAWCDAKHGRQAQLPRELNVEPRVSRHLVNDWLFQRKKPNLEQYFALQAFFRKQRLRGSRCPKD
jgi:hypothetical protein